MLEAGEGRPTRHHPDRATRTPRSYGSTQAISCRKSTDEAQLPSHGDGVLRLRARLRA